MGRRRWNAASICLEHVARNYILYLLYSMKWNPESPRVQHLIQPASQKNIYLHFSVGKQLKSKYDSNEQVTTAWHRMQRVLWLLNKIMVVYCCSFCEAQHKITLILFLQISNIAGSRWRQDKIQVSHSFTSKGMAAAFHCVQDTAVSPCFIF